MLGNTGCNQFPNSWKTVFVHYFRFKKKDQTKRTKKMSYRKPFCIVQKCLRITGIKSLCLVEFQNRQAFSLIFHHICRQSNAFLSPGAKASSSTSGKASQFAQCTFRRRILHQYSSLCATHIEWHEQVASISSMWTLESTHEGTHKHRGRWKACNDIKPIKAHHRPSVCSQPPNGHSESFQRFRPLPQHTSPFKSSIRVLVPFGTMSTPNCFTLLLPLWHNLGATLWIMETGEMVHSYDDFDSGFQ